MVLCASVIVAVLVIFGAAFFVAAMCRAAAERDYPLDQFQQLSGPDEYRQRLFRVVDRGHEGKS
jgi:hypothetical protein